ncbi:YfzA-like protein [Paenibacillus uliginis N3/975]|uniref:YfzA-like protein n=1 Tax=Paenibacillus uliginis N3/975 TaxID=1313296 RepID=A0A1X7HEM2_9BACL|nr:YfzA family protein [Paenibacillus uliginis]SMF85038.1 YfzA-like protein [Paenibacillus uliginis N3/975]
MTDTQKKQIKSWMITLGAFLLMHIYFIAVDGTSWVPKMNDSGNLGNRFFQWILQGDLFTEWITPYSYPFFNLVTVISTVAVLIAAVSYIFSSIFSKN